MKHEWIKLKYGYDTIEICHWCGMSKKLFEFTECKSRVKIKTKGKKPEVIYR